MEQIKVNFDNVIGKVKPMNAVNNGPIGDPVRQTSGNFSKYKEAKIPYARLHDSSFYSGYGGEWTVDVHRIFRDFDADVDDPKSYIFSPTDGYLRTIDASGTKIFYRLGASIEHGFKWGTYPPKDFLKWAKICEHIIRHYTEGWADGFFYDIEYWEIWNEFDCHNADGSFPCWQGTFDEFGEFFSVVARYLKEKFPKLKIGGPAFAGVWNPVVNEAFFSVMQRDKVKLDFISYHAYMNKIQDLLDNVAMANKVFKQYGYGDVETILNEWNYVKGWLSDDFKYSVRAIKAIKGASFTSACMLVGQTLKLDMLMYYDARPGGFNGLFASDFLEPLKGYYPFLYYSKIRELENSVEYSTDAEDVYCIASAKGRKYRMMMTFFKPEDDYVKKNVSLNFEGLDLSSPLSLKVYATDNESDMRVVTEKIIDANNKNLELETELFGVYYIEIDSVK